MGYISFRNWNFWINKDYFIADELFQGYFECIILPTLMVQQTVEFLTEDFLIGFNSIQKKQRAPRNIVAIEMTSSDGLLCIKIREKLDTSIPLEEIIGSVLEVLEAISICVDTALTCNRINFVSDNYGLIFSASPKPIGRGMAFEVEERWSARNRILSDFQYCKQAPKNVRVGIKHYLAGLSLLGLEDQISGLLDAAFIQFCQGCEAICSCTSGNLSDICIYIARQSGSDICDLQIIAHHVWQVRNNYFGHGGVEQNYKAISNYNDAMQVSKQVLVARFLCKKLIDMCTPSNEILIREMRFYLERGSEMYNGTVEELGSTFRVKYPGRTAKVYDKNGQIIKRYQIP